MRLLLLGGTQEARRLANSLHKLGVTVVYSIAGIVRFPALKCEVISGGFSGLGGLKNYIHNAQIDAILDATHPYATQMSHTAINTAVECDIAYWRFYRTAWQATAQDNWKYFSDYTNLLPKLSPFSNRFICVGQLSETELYGLSSPQDCQLIIRGAKETTVKLPTNCIFINAIGPFDVDAELALMQTYKVDVIVCKNSGGEQNVAKINAARYLSIPVFMKTRPCKLPAQYQFYDENNCVSFVYQQHHQHHHN